MKQGCNCCPRKCNIDRDINIGFCGAGKDIKLSRASLHFGEEPFISGNKGSGTIFFSGCSLKCVYCQNYDISNENFGQTVNQEEFIDIIKDLERKGAHNINFVTPTHYFSNIADALNVYRPNIPLLYNSSGYDNLENIKKDLFDIYLFDLKYKSSDKSMRYSGVHDYFSVASNVIKTAVEMVGTPKYNDVGLMTRGVVVRHLILPQSTNDSIEIIKWLNENANNIVFSLMNQYVPIYRANEFKEINRKITKREYEKVIDACCCANFSDIFIQESSSATKELIPKFDLTGIKIHKF